MDARLRPHHRNPEPLSENLMTNTKSLCIYHSHCADGFAGAWVIRQILGDAIEFHPGVYGEDPPSVAGRVVILVDFSYPRAILKRMADEAAIITVLDHHKSAIEDLAGLVHPKLRLVLDASRSGARIAWDFYAGPYDPPKLLQHIEDRDLWRFRLEGTREIIAALFSYPYDFATWDHLMGLPDLGELATEGRAIERKQAKDINELLKLTTRFMAIGGYAVPVANLPYTMASDAAGHLAENMPFAATYYDTEKERVFSLRSRSEGLDVSLIAQQYGGGGHRNAAGFRIGLQVAWRMDRRAHPPATPECIGIHLAPTDLERMEQAVGNLQATAPELGIDDCINTLFLTGLAMAESPGGIDVVSSYARVMQRTFQTPSSLDA